MVRPTVALAVAGWLLPCGALGQEAQSFSQWFAEHGKVELEYKLFWYSKERPRDSRKRRSEYRLTLDLDLPVSEQTRFVFIPEIRWDSHHLHAGTFDEKNRDEARRPIFHFKEAYVEWQQGPWEVSFGERIFAWGTADGFNPTDNLNPKDYLDPPDDSKIPVLALSTAYYPAEVTSLHAVLVPVFTPTRFQIREGRWTFLPEELPLDIERDLPSDTARNLQYALRAKTSLEGWDVSVSYFDGYNDVGRPTLLFDPLGRPALVELDYDKIRVVGADFATTWNEIGLHGEVAQTFTDAGRDDDYLQYVVGADHTWADILPGQNLRLIVEYAGEEITSDAREPSLLPPTRLSRYLDGSILTKATYEVTESLQAQLKVAANLKGRDNYYFQPSVSYDIRDDLRLKVGADLLVGPRRSFFGQFDDNDRFFLTLLYAF